MSRAYHLIQMSEEEYAKYLLQKMTIDMIMDFDQTKQCAMNCIDEMMSLEVDIETHRFLKKTKEIIKSK
jgi:hypothetical protein